MNNKIRKKIENLTVKVYPYEKEYIEKQESISIGEKKWRYLIDSVEFGWIEEKDLILHGIDLSKKPKGEEYKKWENLAKKIQSCKNDYIVGSETRSDGLKKWSRIIFLIRTGRLKKEQLIGYGIDIDNIL